MVEKFRPNFLNPEVNVGPLDDGKYGGGTFTQVGNLENLPENIRGNVPQGYVIKEYTRGEDPKKLAVRLILSENSQRKDVSHLDIAKELNQRHLMVEGYFKQSLPELVVPTQIIVGRDEVTGKKTLYEIQSRLDESSTVNTKIDKSLWPVYWYYMQEDVKHEVKAGEALENFITYLHNTFPQQIDLFKNQLNIFIEQVTNFQSKENHFPFDLAMLTNLIFTEDGLRLIDTNAVMPIPLPSIEGIDQKDEAILMKFRTNMFDKSLEILKIIESKL